MKAISTKQGLTVLYVELGFISGIFAVPALVWTWIRHQKNTQRAPTQQPQDADNYGARFFGNS